MTILDETDAAKALVTPDGAMLFDLEHEDGTPAGRCTLAVLATFLKSIMPTLTPAPAATTYTLGASNSSVTVGTSTTYAMTPTGGAWPSGVVLTPVATGLSGTFNPTTLSPAGTTGAAFAFTPSAAGSGTISVTSSPAMTNPAGVALTATAAQGSTIAPDGTLTGLPATIVAGQPLSAATFTPPQTVIYFVLYRVAAAVEEGPRWPSSTMPGNLTLLIPQSAGAYTVRAYSAATGGTLAYESAQIAVTAAPGALPVTPAQAADSGATSSSVTMNWSATAASYRVLGRAGVGLAYGSLVDTTVSTNSFTFTGLAASSAARAAIIPQNANGYGTPSGQFLSFTAASA